MKKVWKWIEHNRFVVMSPIIMLAIWILAVGCIPETPSPTDPTRLVNVVELEQEYKLFLIKYEFAVRDLELQQEQQNKIMEMITKLASGNVADWPGLVHLLVGGGGLAAVLDNIRKRTVIATLKRKNA